MPRRGSEACYVADAQTRGTDAAPLADVPKISLSCNMVAAIISWIDRQYASAGGYNANCALGLLISVPWFFALLLDKHAVAVILAMLWSVVWSALFVWRAGPWLQKLEKRWQRKRRR